ncbi:MAG: transcription-repair coupling factor [Alphaproteobacteria bacterium]|nr:transcription-repair coupling factor [Alphaproteobacteria bacterium]MDA8004187.1 transcription-repair coupling factor [Alphaproteobacteria bacterium]MDA8005679.1 transcription-repair coupling factor [Alphaproteobacteria bacterium]MDA8013076.1 transcription-repair coupling factor [Alphaproteobacteria bacterium]
MSKESLNFLQGPAPYRLRALAESIKANDDGRTVLIVSDRISLERAATILSFCNPSLRLAKFPAWDCRPYDRMAPSSEVLALRLDCLARLAQSENSPQLIVTTVAAVLQRLPSPSWLTERSRTIRRGDNIAPDTLLQLLNANGYQRGDMVTQSGEYAMRGGLLDVFSPSLPRPLRLDFFGDTLERMRPFDPLTQRTDATGEHETLTLLPASEFVCDKDSVARFRLAWRKTFGAVATRDAIYNLASEGHSDPGWIHYLPLFHESLSLLSDYLPDADFVIEPDCAAMANLREEEVARGFEAREASLITDDENDFIWRPLPAETLYPKWDELTAAVRQKGRALPVSDDKNEDDSDTAAVAAAPDFAQARVQGKLFARLEEFLREMRAQNRRVLICATSESSQTHLKDLLERNIDGAARDIATLPQLHALAADEIGVALLPLAHGFIDSDTAVLGEHDLLGARAPTQTPARTSHPDLGEAIAGLHSLSQGDIVVHSAYGIGRFIGLEQIKAGGEPHDCLRVQYRDGDSVLVPVESMNVLSRHSDGEHSVELDRLSQSNWQARRARVKERLKDMARRLIAVAAERAQSRGRPLVAPEALYQSFCRGFPYAETPDQLNAIRAVEAELAGGRIMEHLVCGDAGFGKTEVALRAACIVSCNGQQVAIVAPTTLLADQHFRTFKSRFADLPIRVEAFSRLVSAARRKELAAALGRGEIDIIIGTHALLADAVSFADLGLLVIDEEQRFGVRQKERLKSLRLGRREGEGETPAPHVLTLSATPIPRTLQMALGGITSMSLISTPPPDRVTVRSFISPWDSVVVREALLREKARGGQSFVVVSRIADLERLVVELPRLVPELHFCSLHGRCRAEEIEGVMGAFLAGERDVLISTDIIESGLDIPRANTLVVCDADRFGLAQLYQLRGRIGRGSELGWCYFMHPSRRPLTARASRRFTVLRRLDGLGVGFSLAAADLELRGGGNLLGEEQSGHMREVGAELYQEMLESALRSARATAAGGELSEEVKEVEPKIRINVAVLIPEGYVSALPLRLRLYRRMARLESEEERAAFLSELENRFGAVPVEVRNLIDTVYLRVLARRVQVSVLDVTPLGVRAEFAGFPNPAGLLEWLSGVGEGSGLRLHPSGVLEHRASWTTGEAQLAGARRFLEALVDVAEGKTTTKTLN